MTNQEKLEDVIVNLFSGKYAKEEIIATLAWGERNTEIYHPLMKKHQPKYYCEGFGNPIQGFTLILDLGKKPIGYICPLRLYEGMIQTVDT